MIIIIIINNLRHNEKNMIVELVFATSNNHSSAQDIRIVSAAVINILVILFKS